MKDIYGEDYLLISRYDYESLLKRIDKLERDKKEMHTWICDLAQTSDRIVGNTILDLIEIGKNIGRKESINP